MTTDDTTPTSDATAADTAAEETQQTDTTTEEQPGTISREAVTKARGEAATYRERLRNTEAERDALQGRVTALATQLANHAIEATGLKPDAVWASGAKLEDFFTDDGIDDEALAAAASAAREKFGIPRFTGSGDATTRPRHSASSTPSWGDVMKQGNS